MKKNTASPSRLNAIAKGYMDHHNAMKKAAKGAEGSPAEESAESPSQEQSEIDSGKGDGPMGNDPMVNSARKIDKLRKPKMPKA